MWKTFGNSAIFKALNILSFYTKTKGEEKRETPFLCIVCILTTLRASNVLMVTVLSWWWFYCFRKIKPAVGVSCLRWNRGGAGATDRSTGGESAGDVWRPGQQGPRCIVRSLLDTRAGYVLLLLLFLLLHLHYTVEIQVVWAIFHNWWCA